jgi:hypothetical protein
MDHVNFFSADADYGAGNLFKARAACEWNEGVTALGYVVYGIPAGAT